jgi:hypothetical protein
MTRQQAGYQNLFVEGFESGSFGTNGWAVYGTGNPWTVSSSQPFSGHYHAQSQQSGTGNPTYLERSLSTVGYSSINLSYKRKLIGLDAADDFSSQWFDGKNWNTLELVNSENNADYVARTFVLHSSANENPNFKIRFMCEAGAVSEFCRIDDVRVSAGNSFGLWNYVFDTTKLMPNTYTIGTITLQ